MNVGQQTRKFAAEVARGLGLYHRLRDYRRDRCWAKRSTRERLEWERAGRPDPPPSCVKQACIREYARRFGLEILVETGTFYGDTVFALRRVFPEIHTIELAPALHALAVKELGHLPGVHLYFGDSTQVLEKLAPSLALPTLFWLDGHYSAGPTARANKDTPICDELEILLARAPRRDVILVDDARLFIGQNDYPSLDSLCAKLLARRPGATINVRDDIIRIHPI